MKLLQSGSASLYDMDPYGLGLLYYASYYCWRSSGKEVAMRTCQFLLDIGADMDLQDEKGCTPLDTLIGDTLISLSMREHGPRMPNSSDFEHITKLFGRSSFDIVADYIKVSNFVTIHKVLLGIQEDYETLLDYLEHPKSSSPSISTIDIQDSTGRSALAWAVEYGWVVATKALLQHGANPNQLVQSSNTASPLLHLAIAMPVSSNTDNGSLGVVKELLKAGADINAVDHENWTPLHVAASWNNYDIIQELVTFGGEILEWDLVTNDNQSAMDLSLNSGINHQVQSILKNRNRVSEHIYGRGHRDKDEDFESKEEQFFDSEETWCCV
ncbi:Arp Ankyrin repeat protein [Pyrenophora tritici-repentis]|nr:Arp Ankyrin repeat protein [Pyrenophora tritici-repentis]